MIETVAQRLARLTGCTLSWPTQNIPGRDFEGEAVRAALEADRSLREVFLNCLLRASKRERVLDEAVRMVRARYRSFPEMFTARDCRVEIREQFARLWRLAE